MKHTGIYLNQSASQTQSCELVLSGHSLYIYLQNENKDLVIWDLSNVNAQLTHDTLQLSRKSDPTQVLECSNEIAKLIYEEWKNPAPVEKKKGKTSKQVYAFFMIVAAGIVTCSLLIYFFVFPWLVEKSTGLISTQVETEIGNKLSEAYKQNGLGSDSLNFYLNAFTDQLHIHSPYTLEVNAIESPEINAFAVPGGHIFIYTGMLQKMTSYEQLAALLGHEITHVTERHSLKSMLRGAASGLIVSALFGDVSNLAPWLLSKADELKQLDYSRDLETEADTKGLHLMVQNKIDPSGMIKLLELLNSESEQTPALMKYLSTHPETQARMGLVRENPESKLEFPPNPRLQAAFDGVKRNL